MISRVSAGRDDRSQREDSGDVAVRYRREQEEEEAKKKKVTHQSCGIC